MGRFEAVLRTEPEEFSGSVGKVHQCLYLHPEENLVFARDPADTDGLTKADAGFLSFTFRPPLKAGSALSAS